MLTSADAPRVVVSGGASGIGRATTLAFLASGSRVAVIDVDERAASDLREVASPRGERLSLHLADVSVEDEVRIAVGEAVTWLGGADALISAAGIMRGQLRALADFDEATWDQVVDINLKGAFLLAKHVAPTMLAAGRGTIVLVGSKGGVAVGSGSYAYGASKGGVHGLALTLARQLEPHGIRVNDVCPGDVDTPLYRRSVAEGVDEGGDQDTANAMLERLTPPERIADVLVFLASDAASAVRGTIFTA